MAQLRGHINDSQTTFQVDDTTNLPTNGGVVELEDELVRYTTATDKALLGCERGYNSTAAAAHDDHTPVELQADASVPAQITELSGSADPTDSLTGVLKAPIGTRYTNTTTGHMFLNTGTDSAPEWSILEASGDITAADINSGDATEGQILTADGSGATSWEDAVDTGITQLTGDVTAGPGNGSKAATLANTAVTPGSYTSADITVDAKGRVTAAASNASNLPPNVVSMTNSTDSFFTSNSTTFVATGIAATITPSSNTKKILVSVLMNANQLTSADIFYTVFRDATDLSGAGGFLVSNPAVGSDNNCNSFMVLDAPASTSALVYEVYVRSSTGTWRGNTGGGICSITLMEVH